MNRGQCDDADFSAVAMVYSGSQEKFGLIYRFPGAMAIVSLKASKARQPQGVQTQWTRKTFLTATISEKPCARVGRYGALATIGILFAQGNLEFQPLAVPDPVPLGRQILEAAGLEPKAGYSLFGILPSGDFEDVRLRRNLRPPREGCGTLRRLPHRPNLQADAGRGPNRMGRAGDEGRRCSMSLRSSARRRRSYLDVRGGKDRMVDPGESIDLAEPGIERFITAPKGGRDVRDYRQFAIQDGAGPRR